MGIENDLGQYYRTLDLEPGATREDIKRAWRDLTKVWHPDRFQGDPRMEAKAEEKLKEINQAYERLTAGWIGAPGRPKDAAPPRPAAASGQPTPPHARPEKPRPGPSQPSPAPAQAVGSVGPRPTRIALILLCLNAVGFVFLVLPHGPEVTRHLTGAMFEAAVVGLILTWLIRALHQHWLLVVSVLVSCVLGFFLFGTLTSRRSQAARTRGQQKEESKAAVEPDPYGLMDIANAPLPGEPTKPRAPAPRDPYGILDIARAPYEPSPGGAAKTEDEETVYVIGLRIGGQVTVLHLSAGEVEAFQRGVADAATGQKPAVDPDVYGPKVQPFAQARMQKAAEAGVSVAPAQKQKGAEFAAASAKEPGAVMTATGLVFKSLSAGNGKSPEATDTVKVHYRGTFTDGTEFDSSIKRGEPVNFALNGVIPCWTEGVQKMKVGEKARLVCPSSTAYGDQGRPPTIPGGATLVFEVELLAIKGK